MKKIVLIGVRMRRMFDIDGGLICICSCFNLIVNKNIKKLLNKVMYFVYEDVIISLNIFQFYNVISLISIM